MADQGFTAFEDNDIRKRGTNLQEKMASTMIKRGLRSWECLLLRIGKNQT